jgi:hypothetical protein
MRSSQRLPYQRHHWELLTESWEMGAEGPCYEQATRAQTSRKRSAQ